MFIGMASSLNKIAMFNDFNIISKTITVSNKEIRTEDMKLFPIYFECIDNIFGLRELYCMFVKS